MRPFRAGKRWRGGVLALMVCVRGRQIRTMRGGEMSQSTPMQTKSHEAVEGGEGPPGQSVTGRLVLPSALLLVLALALLIWNDGRRTPMVTAIDQMVAEMVQAPQTGIDPSLEGKPVAVTGQIASKGEVFDEWFRIATPGPVLVRDVRMYQWLESDSALPGWLGGGKRVHQGWASGRRDTSQFVEATPHTNPDPPVPGTMNYGMDAQFGPYRIAHEALVARAIADSIAGRSGAASLADWVLAIAPLPAPGEALVRQGWVLRGEATYARHDADPAEPKVGDVEVRFYTLANGARGSVIGAQQGALIVPWRAADGSLVLIAGAGKGGLDALIAQARIDAGAGRGWLRGLALVLALLGGAVWVAHGPLAPLLGSRLERVPPLVAGATVGAVLAGIAIALAYALGAFWAALLLALMVVVSGFVLAYSNMRSTTSQVLEARLRDEPEARARAAAVLAATAPASAPAPEQPPATPDPPREELPPLEWDPDALAKARRDVEARMAAESEKPAEPVDETVDVLEFVNEPPPTNPATAAAPAGPAPTPAPAAPAPAPARPDSAAPLFETVAPREAAPPAPLLSEPPAPRPADPAPRMLRIALGQKGDFQINKLVRKQADGREEILGYELTRAGAVVFRGSQEQVKARLRELLLGS